MATKKEVPAVFKPIKSDDCQSLAEKQAKFNQQPMIKPIKPGPDDWDAHYKKMPINAVIKEMATLALLKEELDEKLKAVNKEYDFLRINIVPKRMDDEGIESPYSVKGVGKITLTGDMYVSIPEAFKDLVYKWFCDLGKNDLYIQTLNASTLKATVKALIKAGVEIPTVIEDKINGGFFPVIAAAKSAKDSAIPIIKTLPFTRAAITHVK